MKRRERENGSAKENAEIVSWAPETIFYTFFIYLNQSVVYTK